MLSKQEQSRPQLEPMLPLINIVFLLLIFFLLAGQAKAPSNLAIKPPQLPVNHQTIDELPSEWLYLQLDGQLQYKQKTMTDDVVITELSQSTLVLFADTKTPGSVLASTLNRLTDLGVKQVLVISETSNRG